MKTSRRRVRNRRRVARVHRLFRMSDSHGLHARPAALIAGTASQFEADILVRHGESVADGKSMLDLLVLCAGPGGLLTIVTEGVDAIEAMNGLEGAFQRHAFLISEGPNRHTGRS